MTINIGEYGTWDKYILLCDEIRGLTEVERERVKESLSYLRRVFGEYFPLKAFNNRHPLFHALIDNGGIKRLWLVCFSEALHALRAMEGFSGLLRRIKRADMFEEGASVLEVAFQFLSAGFKISFDPPVIVTLQSGEKRPKIPDLKIVNEETGEEIIVEVSILNIGASFRESFDTSSFSLRLFSRVLRPASLTIHLRISEAFDEACVEGVLKQLEELASEAARTGEFRALVNEYVEAGIAPESNKAELDSWTSERGIDEGTTGPSIPFDDISRARMKIRDKLAQLPENRPGIIAILATNTMLFRHYDIGLIISVLSEEIKLYPKLWGVLLSHNHINQGGREIVSIGPHKVVNKMIANALHRETVILLNESCAVLITSATQDKIVRALA